MEKATRKRLAEILDIEEIAKFHSTKDLLQRAATKEKRDFYWKKISDAVDNTDDII